MLVKRIYEYLDIKDIKNPKIITIHVFCMLYLNRALAIIIFGNRYQILTKRSG
jgi:hypothetical protein